MLDQMNVANEDDISITGRNAVLDLLKARPSGCANETPSSRYNNDNPNILSPLDALDESPDGGYGMMSPCIDDAA
eukprot:1399802-Ditylum_brightwellii.AAC.1